MYRASVFLKLVVLRAENTNLTVFSDLPYFYTSSVCSFLAMHYCPQVHLFRTPCSRAISNVISSLYSTSSKPLEPTAWEIIISIPEEGGFKIPLHLVG